MPETKVDDGFSPIGPSGPQQRLDQTSPSNLVKLAFLAKTIALDVSNARLAQPFNMRPRPVELAVAIQYLRREIVVPSGTVHFNVHEMKGIGEYQRRSLIVTFSPAAALAVVPVRKRSVMEFPMEQNLVRAMWQSLSHKTPLRNDLIQEGLKAIRVDASTFGPLSRKAILLGTQYGDDRLVTRFLLVGAMLVTFSGYNVKRGERGYHKQYIQAFCETQNGEQASAVLEGFFKPLNNFVLREEKKLQDPWVSATIRNTFQSFRKYLSLRKLNRNTA